MKTGMQLTLHVPQLSLPNKHSGDGTSFKERL
jgi:hypothetical protein